MTELLEPCRECGNAYVTGSTSSIDFPTMNPLQAALGGGGGDAFVAEINPSGSALVYSTYLGGSGGEVGSGIAVDSAGNAYVIGFTSSANFPTTPSAFQTICNGGSNCFAHGDAFVTKINSGGSAFVYSTYLGGSGDDRGYGIAADSAGNAYVTGGTGSADFPVTPGAFQPVCNGTCSDAFVTKIDSAGTALVYSTYLGGSGNDQGNSIAVDSTGNAYVTGYTSGDFPTKNPIQAAYGGGHYDAFVSKLNPTGSALAYSTYLGGTGTDTGNGIAVDSLGYAYVIGTSGHSPYTDKVLATKINPAGSAFIFSTFLFGGSGSNTGGGIAVDNSRNAYITGATNSTNFPTKNPLQPANAGGGNGFVSKIQMLAVTTTTLTSSPNPSTYGEAANFTAVVTSSAGAPPDGETVTFMKGTKVLGTGTLSAGSASFTTSTLPAGNNLIKAVYGGDANIALSTSKAVDQVVNKATTTTTLTSSLNPSNFGQSVTFMASVTPQFSGKVTGTVTFYDGTTALKTVALSGGVAKFATSTLASGAHNITATYNGSTSFTGISASLTQTVN